jgi:tetratricopeptide (TPR) repeat protein
MRRTLMLGALALVPLVLYARTASFDYVQADDTDLIRGNISFLQDLRNADDAFGRSYFETAGQPSGRKTYYRPLVVLSFMVDAQVESDAPRAYHVTNVALHAAAVLLVFGLLRGFGVSDTPAFVSALIFAVHPANVQSVAWIPGRNDTLMSIGALVSLLALVKYTRTSHWRWLALHGAGFAAALFTKESALGLVVLFVLYLLLWPGLTDRSRRMRSMLFAVVPVVAFWFGLMRAALSGDVRGGGVLDSLGALYRNLPDLLLYAEKIVAPVHLSIMPGLTRFDATLGALSIMFIVWLLTRLEPGKRWFVAAWLLVFLLPALLVPGLPAYEHRLYFPLIGFVIALAELPVWRHPDRRRAVVIGALAIASLFGAIAFAHADVFRDRYRYWSSATTGTPFAGIALVNLGQIYEGDGDLARAADSYRAALDLDPATPGAHNNLGVLAARAGRLTAAVAEFEQEIKRHPGNADAYFNLGLVAKLSNRPDEAAQWWERTIAADPSHDGAHEELAQYYEAKGDTARAARHRDAIRISR